MSKDKLSKEDIRQMAVYIPMMLDDLKGHKYHTRFLVRWDNYKKNGAMGHELVRLYMMIKEQLPDLVVNKYP